MTPKATHYIYFLLRGSRVLYVGCSSNVTGRLKAHKYTKPHTAVRIMGPFIKSFAFMNETRWIKRFNPEYNAGGNNAGRKKGKPSEKVILVGFYTKKR